MNCVGHSSVNLRGIHNGTRKYRLGHGFLCIGEVMLPGLSLFYSGLVRGKNALATAMHSFSCLGIVLVVRMLWGYSLAFGPTDEEEALGLGCIRTRRNRLLVVGWLIG